MKKAIVVVLMIMTLGLVGCVKDNIGSPCPNFGKSCSKTPINSWNYNN